MTDACPRSRRNFHLLRRLCFLLCVLLGCCLFPVSPAQELDKPLQNIDEEITAFSFAPDGRIAYSVRRLFKTKQYDLQRDDIWIQEAGGTAPRRSATPSTPSTGRPTAASFLPSSSPPRSPRTPGGPKIPSRPSSSKITARKSALPAATASSRIPPTPPSSPTTRQSSI